MALQRFSISLIAGIFWGIFGTKAQNLVPNPSFEEISNCPTESNQTDKEDYLNYASPWHQACLTPDLIASCSPKHNCVCVSVEENFTGSQSPQHGKNYAGMFACIYHHWEEGLDTSGEYIYVPLKDSLQRGHKYQISAWLSLADKEKYCLNQLGAHFSKSIISPYKNDDYCNQVLPYRPQVQLSASSQWLDEKDSWMFVQDSFVAEGGEKYMTIGNFARHQPIKIKEVEGIRDDAYYYIDNVQLKEKGKHPNYKPKVFVPNAFSPNGDKLNDHFRPLTAIDLQDYTFKIYNRWGEQIYQSQNQHKGWDGMHQGRPAPEGTYVWRISYRGVLDEVYQREGFVVLVR